ncbi:MAG: hypothetical protein M1834_000952 [Cirrosporium novae-zelandiae]|nr:MAG: hypothetical protein M1834_000952 [Cirrosporium novae-zelandiae]
MSDYEFFNRFPDFEPNPSAPIAKEFARLARQKNWNPNSKVYRRMKVSCYQSEFTALYGEDSSKLQNWQSLCRDVRVKKPTDTISQCKKVRIKALKATHVNLVDLVDCRRTGKKLRKFSSQQELRDYTANTPGKVFPKASAKADGFLKALLREIF